MADIEVDPVVLRARAAQLAEAAERLAGAAARARESADGLGPLGAAVAGRQDALASGLAADAETLALVADRLRREADAVAATERTALAGLTAITWSLG